MTSRDSLLLPNVLVAQVRQPLRLRLSEAPGRTTLGGEWWPQSRQIDRELADLVDRLPAAMGRVDRAEDDEADEDDGDPVAEANGHWFDEGDVWWSRPELGPPSMRCGS